MFVFFRYIESDKIRIKVTELLCWGRSPSYDADSHAVILRPLTDPKARYCLQKSLQLEPVPNRMNPVHTSI
jgi:hypothetical protein